MMKKKVGRLIEMVVIVVGRSIDRPIAGSSEMDFLRRIFSTENYKKDEEKKQPKWKLSLPLIDIQTYSNQQQFSHTNHSKIMERDLLIMNEILFDDRRRVDIVPNGIHEMESYPDKTTSYHWLASSTPSLLKFHKSKFYPKHVEKLRLHKIGVIPTLNRMWAFDSVSKSVFMWNFITGDDVIQLKHSLSGCINFIEVVPIDYMNNIIATHILFLFSSTEICAIGVDLSESRDYCCTHFLYSINLNGKIKILNNFTQSKLSSITKNDIVYARTTSDGHVLVVDSYGALYELRYKLKDGKFLNRYFYLDCKISDKIIRKNMFSTWFKNERLNHEDFMPIQMEIDEDRSYLYLLCVNNVIKIYTVSDEYTRITEHVIFNASKVKLPYENKICNGTIISKVVAIGICSKKYSKIAKFIVQYQSGAKGFFSVFEHYMENRKQYCAEMVHFVYSQIVEPLNTDSTYQIPPPIKISIISDASASLNIFTSSNDNTTQSVILAQQIQAQLGEVYPITNYEICKCDLKITDVVPFKVDDTKLIQRKRPYYFAESTAIQCQSGGNLYLLYGREGYCILKMTQITDVVEKMLLNSDFSTHRKIIDNFIKRYGLMTIFYSLISVHVKYYNRNENIRRSITRIVMDMFCVRYHFKLEKSFEKGHKVVLVPEQHPITSSIQRESQPYQNMSVLGDHNIPNNVTIQQSSSTHLKNSTYFPSITTVKKPDLSLQRSNTLYHTSQKYTAASNASNINMNQTTCLNISKYNEMKYELNSLYEKCNKDTRKRKADDMINFKENLANNTTTQQVSSTNFLSKFVSELSSQYINQLSVYSLGFNQYFAIIIEPLFNSLFIDQIHLDDGSTIYFSRYKMNDIAYWLEYLHSVKASLNEFRFILYSRFENIPLIDSVDILNAKAVKTLEFLVDLTDKSIQILNFFVIVFEYNLDKFLKHLLSINISIDALKMTKFSHFVMKQNVTRNVLSDFISYINTIDYNNLRVVLKKLSQSCSTFFTEIDMRFILTTRNLADIYTMQEGSEKTMALKDSLTILKDLNKIISTVACFELLLEMNCLCDVLVLAASKYTILMDSCESKCNNESHNARYLLYFIISILDLLYNKYFNVTDTSNNNSQFNDGPLYQSIKVLLEEINNENFHYLIYYWMILHNLMDFMMNMNGFFFEKFLYLNSYEITTLIEKNCELCVVNDFWPKRLLVKWKILEKQNKMLECAKTLIQLSQISTDGPINNEKNEKLSPNLLSSHNIIRTTTTTDTMSDDDLKNHIKCLINNLIDSNRDSFQSSNSIKSPIPYDMAIINRITDGNHFSININDRVDYLGRAMIYLKSHTTDHSHLLSSINEKIDRASNYFIDCETLLKAAKMQSFIHNEVERINLFVPTSTSNTLANTLYYSIFSYMELLSKVVEPYGLHCSKLLSLAQLGMSVQDDYLIALWKCIIEREFYMVLRHNNNNLINLKLPQEDLKSPQKIVHNSLKNTFKCFRVENPSYFPLYDIFRILHLYACQYSLEYNWCYELILDIQIDFMKIVELYTYLLKDPVNDISYDQQKNWSFPLLCSLSYIEFIFSCEEFQKIIQSSIKHSQRHKKIKNNEIFIVCELGSILQKRIPQCVHDPKRVEEYLKRLRSLITKLSEINNN